MSLRHKSREIALQTLYQLELKNISLESTLDFDWIKNKKRIPSGVFIFAETIITGTLNHLEEIDMTIENHLTNWKLDKITKIDLSILRMSSFSLLFQNESIPPAVTLNEAVQLAKKFSSEKSHQFINGVLGAILNSIINKSEE